MKTCRCQTGGGVSHREDVVVAELRFVLQRRRRRGRPWRTWRTRGTGGEELTSLQWPIKQYKEVWTLKEQFTTKSQGHFCHHVDAFSDFSCVTSCVGTRWNLTGGTLFLYRTITWFIGINNSLLLSSFMSLVSKVSLVIAPLIRPCRWR